MANILIEDMQPGTIITVICEYQGEIEGPDPGEEAPEEAPQEQGQGLQAQGGAARARAGVAAPRRSTTRWVALSVCPCLRSSALHSCIKITPKYKHVYT